MVINKTISFCVGTGRCGTTFITQLAQFEPKVAAYHERFRLPATFHMFCKWHKLPVDSEGFLQDRAEAVALDLKENNVVFEASALLSHSIAELAERFSAQFLLLVRRPDETVASFAVRRWFLDTIPWKNTTAIPSITEGQEPRHFLGRNLPRGEAFHRWNKLTQVGKLAWFWQVRNRAILEQLQTLAPHRVRILRLEDFSFNQYAEAAEFLGWRPSISEDTFLTLARTRPNTGPNPPQNPSNWSSLEVQEFEHEVAAVANALGYEHQIAALRAGRPACKQPCPSVHEAADTLQKYP